MAHSLDKHRPSSDGDKADDLRGFEWYLLTRLARTRPLVLRHPASLYRLAFSPDGATCATGHRDGSIALWDVAGGRQRSLWSGHKLHVLALAFSPDGEYLVSGAASGEGDELRLWQARTGKTLAVFPTSLGAITSLAFAADGRALATAINFGRGAGEIKLWTVPSGTLRTTIALSTSVYPTSVAFSADGRTLVVGLTDGTISLRDAATGHALETRSEHQGYVRSVACGHKRL